MSESYEDVEWVVKGPHASMVIKHPIELLETEILSLLRIGGGVRLSQIWLRCNCHLWEVSLALKRLKDKGLVEESPLRP
jgi:Mn-dependent DtxR family transcriptional regulator